MLAVTLRRKKRNKMTKILKYLFFLSVLPLFFAGCSPCERLARRCPPVAYERDSIHVIDTLWFETIIIDTPTPVKLPPEYIYIEKQITDTAKGETSFTRGMAWIDGESLRLELINKDSAEVLVQRIKTLERQLHEEQKFKEKTVVDTEYRTRGIVKVFMWIGIAAVAFGFLYLIVLALKRF